MHPTDGYSIANKMTKRKSRKFFKKNKINEVLLVVIDITVALAIALGCSAKLAQRK